MDKWDEVEELMERLGIKNEDLLEKFILGSGKGGQKVNKTSSCVYLKHLPSGIEVKCQKTRSRDLNRLYARRELSEKIQEQVFKKKTEKKQKIEKLRRQKRKRSKRAQEKVLFAKKKTSEKKQWRQPPSSS